MPYAAATPIAGAPRTASTRIASASSGAVRAAKVDLLAGKPPLVEDDDGVVLEPDDPVRCELGHASGETSLAPARPHASGVRLEVGHHALTSLRPSSRGTLACSSVSSSIATPIVASLSRAISSSISFGTS